MSSRKISVSKQIVRCMNWDDIPQILWLTKNLPSSPWMGPDFVHEFRSNETLGYVVERDKRVVGFAICRISHPGSIVQEKVWQRIGHLIRWLMNIRTSEPRHLHLIGMGVAAEVSMLETERILLEKLEEQLRHPGDHLWILIPERHLHAQQFLREAGYRAIRVLKRHYGSEDAYLMIRKIRTVNPVVLAPEPRLSPPGKELTPGETVCLRA